MSIFPDYWKFSCQKLLQNKSRYMDTVKNVVRYAYIFRSICLKKCWAQFLSQEKINLIWEITYIVFLAHSESTIFLDAVQEKLLEFRSGQF